MSKKPSAQPALPAKATAEPPPPAKHEPVTLSVDIGGTGLKASVLDSAGNMLHERVRVPTPRDDAPDQLITTLQGLTHDLPPFDRISVGYPGAVESGRVLTAPHFSDPAWIGFDLASAFAQAFGKPARVSNDADIQGFGVVSGKGIEMVLTLGTGAGTAVFRDGVIGPHMEFAHHPVHGKKTYNEYIGTEALKKAGPKRWSKRVHKVIAILENLVHYDKLYVGGGNGEKLEGKLPDNVTVVSNTAGITGGIALWRDGFTPQ